MGGKPSKGTSKDQRLSRNNPNAGKTKTTQAVMPMKPMNKQSKKGC